MAIAHTDDSVVQPQWSVMEEQSMTGITLSAEVIELDQFRRRDDEKSTVDL